jgi:hypothetical protein
MTPLPLCAHCQQQAVKRRQVNGKACRYCSRRCYGAALRTATLAARPLCLSCREKPVSKTGGRYCGKSCDMLHRRVANPVFEAKRRTGWAKAMDRMREGHVRRMRAHLEACFQAVFDGHPEWTEADRLAILKGGLAVHRKAYVNGWKARDTRMKRSA